MSVSVYDEESGRWRQTWVDSVGNYWAFREGRDGDLLTFETTDLDDGREVRKRMVFTEIEREGLTWRWERSFDGVVWDPVWSIRYRRAHRASGPARNR